MALELRQQQRLEFRLTMRLQQAIKLLQLNHLELVAAVQQELAENPTLEEVPGTSTPEVGEVEARLARQASEQSADEAERNNGQEEGGGIEWERVLEDMSADRSAFGNAAGPSRFDDLPPIEANLTAAPSLTEHLSWQLAMQSCSEAERAAALAIIHNLDSRGYLDATLEQVAEEAEVDAETAERALAIVQSLDPLGCGGRDLVEVLLVQARHAWPEDPVIGRIIRDHLGDLETRNYAAIARALDIEVEDAIEYHKMLQTLEPWPGRPYAETANHTIIPDIEVRKVDGEWRVFLNEDGLPKLRISGYYRRVLQDPTASRQDRKYIKERLDSADFLISSIYKRQDTIRKVVEKILEFQRDFFERGPEHLRPMVLRDIADAIGMHESTISRVTTNKYMLCPHGIFELKYFFNAGIQRMSGGDLAAEAVRQKIRKLIAEEDPRKPLSDQKIVKLLAEENIRIARRTVAKYREAMGILPSTQRKQLY